MADKEIYRVEIPIVVDDQTDKPLQQAERKINRFEKSAKKTNDRIRRIFGREIRLRLGAVDRVTSVVRGAQSHLRGLTSKAWNVTIQAKDKVSGILSGITGGIRKIGRLLTSPLTLMGVGGGLGGLSKFGIDMVIERENITMAFETLLGSADKARKRIEELTEFASQTPFLRDEIYEASRILEVFTRGALSTGKGLKLVGDIAAGTGEGFNNVALWIGRLYDAMASGRPVGEMTSRLQEMGAISGEQRALLEELAESGKDISKTWPQAEKVLSRFEGQMEKMSTGLGNMLTSVKSFFRETILLRWGQGIESELRPVLERFRQWRREHPEQVAAIGDAVEGIVRSGIRRVKDLFKNGYALISDIIDDESLTWSEKISIALDRILTTFGEWLQGTGGEMIRTATKSIGEIIVTGLVELTPVIVPHAVDIGLSIGKGILSGAWEAITSSPIAGAILGALGGAKVGAMVGTVGGVPGMIVGAVGGAVVGGGAAAIRGAVKDKHQFGGILTRPHIGLVAEAGPEAIIPLSTRTRSRALALYEETGRRLGVKTYAEGGFAGQVTVAAPSLSGNTPIINLNFDLAGLVRQVVINNESDIDKAIDKIADNLRSAFQNMTNKTN